jgi:adenylate cyclase class 2
MKKGSQEIEIKLAVPDARTARRMLRDAGFQVFRPRVFEENTIFDTKDQQLRKSSRLLRIRTAGRNSRVTYKGPPDAGRHKSREELEVEVNDAKTMSVIVERVGFQATFRYEKYRTEYRRPRSSGVAVVDETPIGVYLELEGTPAWIDRTAKQLGFSESDYITASYGRLYLDWCKKHKCKTENMVFA